MALEDEVGEVLKVGSRGEIYLKKNIRERLGIEPGGYVKAYVKGGKLIIEPLGEILFFK